MLNRVIYYLQKSIFSSSRTLGIIGAGLLPVLVLLTTVDVVSRRLLNSPIPGAFELTGFILGITVFFTLAYCAAEGGHVEVDILMSRFPQKIQKSIASVMYLFSTVLLGLLSWQLFLLAIRVKDMNETSAILAIWLFPFIFIAAIGATLLTLVFLVMSLNNLSGVLNKLA